MLRVARGTHHRPLVQPACLAEALLASTGLGLGFRVVGMVNQNFWGGVSETPGPTSHTSF